MIASTIFTTAHSTCPQRRREKCLVADEETFSSQKVLMQDLAGQQDLFGQYDKLFSFNRKFKYVLLKKPCLYVKRL
jgi:hypothetical protein